MVLVAVHEIEEAGSRYPFEWNASFGIPIRAAVRLELLLSKVVVSTLFI